uniref:Uncharacterized protein n=1 Tax=Oryza punctata TaxID=4537 RepID=A0A0E0M408_ORYPU
MGAAAEEVVVVRPPSSGKRRSTTLLHLFQLEKADVGVMFPAGTAKLPPPSPEPEADCLIGKIDSCSRVAERALYMWNNERFVAMACAAGPAAMEERILPAFVASMEVNLEQHWSRCVQQVTASVRALLDRVAPGAYARCTAGLAARRAEAEADAAARRSRWRRLELAADDADAK